MTTRVITVSPELSIRDAMELFAAHHVSGAPVVGGGEIIGLVSATDLLTFAASLPGVPTERADPPEWGEWETPPSESSNENDPPAAFFDQLWEDAGAESTERMAEVTGPEWNALEEHTVGEAMTQAPLLGLPPDASVTAAADTMRRAGVHRVLVMEGRTLLGIVSTMDIARAVADRKLTAHT